MEIKKLQKLIVKFRDARDWKQFHNPKDIALSIILESAELIEHFQWKSKEEMEEYVKTDKKHIGEELVDVFYWILLMAYDLDIDLPSTLKKKMKKNEEKYPIEKARGSHKKYTEL
jgi:NTP pyrophosphatase (non-canonical NTP hydrolase)